MNHARRMAIAIPVIVAGVTLTGCASTNSGHPRHAAAAASHHAERTLTAYGQMTVKDSSADPSFGETAAKDYSDITTGTQVVVTRSDGKVIAYGTLHRTSKSAKRETFSFTVSVPAGLPRYGLTVSHRGTVWFTGPEMTDGPELVLGS